MITEIEPPKDLLEKIIKRIHKEERILVLRKTILFSATLAVSMFALIPTFKILLSDFSQTGFINFSSLLFSDFYAVMSHWQSFAIVLLETLPIISLALFLAVILTFLQSLKSLSKNVKIIKSHHLITN
jgi:hypothetical protein